MVNEEEPSTHNIQGKRRTVVHASVGNTCMGCMRSHIMLHMVEKLVSIKAAVRKGSSYVKAAPATRNPPTSPSIHHPSWCDGRVNWEILHPAGCDSPYWVPMSEGRPIIMFKEISTIKPNYVGAPTIPQDWYPLGHLT